MFTIYQNNTLALNGLLLAGVACQNVIYSRLVCLTKSALENKLLIFFGADHSII